MEERKKLRYRKTGRPFLPASFCSSHLFLTSSRIILPDSGSRSSAILIILSRNEIIPTLSSSPFSWLPGIRVKSLEFEKFRGGR